MDKLPLDSDYLDRSDGSDRNGPWAFQLALCLLGPLFFVSYLFTILAPLPLLYLHVGTPNPRKGRIWAGIAVLIGTVLSAAVHGWLWGSLSFFLFASLPALVLGELLIRRSGPERAILGAVIAVLASASASGLLIQRTKGIEIIPTIQKTTETLIRQSVDHLLSQPRNEASEATLEELKALKDRPGLLMEDLPGLSAALLLLLCSLPCIALIRWNPKGFLRRSAISRDFLRKWSSPDWLIWPALFCGAFLIFDAPYLTDIARNLLKPIVLIYFFHGMSILAFFLDSLRLRGPIRVIFYGTAVLFLTLMVVSFGFFDLWFSFRSRNRFGNREKED